MYMFMEMLRTRGTVCPWYGPEVGFTVDLSAGHFQMAVEFPQ